MMNTSSSTHGSGFLTVLGIPFAVSGLWAFWQGLRLLESDNQDTEKLAVLILVGLIFGGAGVAMILLGRYLKSKGREKNALRQLHPDSPWMWRPDWAQGRVKGASKSTLVVSWVFAVFWNLISVPLLFQLPKEYARGNTVALIGLLFPLVGVGMIIWAVRATVRHRKFGTSTFAMTALPGVIGGRVRGAIETGLQTLPDKGVALKLSSIRRTVSGTGKNRTTHERVLWQEESNIPRARLQPAYRGTSVPVEFRVPYECEQTDETDPSNSIVWRLEADADIPGIDFKTQFEVPVFKTPESSPEAAEEEAEFGFAHKSEQEFNPLEATVVVRPSPLGGTEYYFGAARNFGAAVGMTVFLIIWLGAIWLQLYLGAPMLFPIVCGLLGVLIFVAVIHLWVGVTLVRIEAGAVTIRRSVLGLGRRREIPCSDITAVKAEIGMQQGQTATQSAKAYYDIKLHRKVGRPNPPAAALATNEKPSGWPRICGQRSRRAEGLPPLTVSAGELS